MSSITPLQAHTFAKLRKSFLFSKLIEEKVIRKKFSRQQNIKEKKITAIFTS